MRRLTLLLVPVLALSACGGSGSRTDHANGLLPEKNLTLMNASTDKEIVFTILDEEKTFKEFGIGHTKDMHLVVVRDDLTHFEHLHPQMDTDGVWRLPYTPAAGGNYWMYADFVDKSQRTYLRSFTGSYAAPLGTYGIVAKPDTTLTMNGYTFAMRTEEIPGALMLHYTIKDAAGKLVTPEDYLGEKGHSVLINPKGEYVHTHPVAIAGGVQPPEYRGVISFAVTKEHSGFYRIFTQFKLGGKVMTVPFDLNAGEYKAMM